MLFRSRKVISSGAYKSLKVSELVKAGLRREEAQVFCRFAEVTRLAASDEAVRQGTTYDLCYCNMSSDGFDKHRHFAFLRDHEEHTLMVVANFSNREATMKLTLPQHAFDWMEIPVTEDLYPGKLIEVTVPPMDAKLITLI